MGEIKNWLLGHVAHLGHGLENLKSFCGKRDAFNCRIPV